jgi:hypothetical protein
MEVHDGPKMGWWSFRFLLALTILAGEFVGQDGQDFFRMYKIYPVNPEEIL